MRIDALEITKEEKIDTLDKENRLLINISCFAKLF